MSMCSYKEQMLGTAAQEFVSYLIDRSFGPEVSFRINL